jgi:hypothetical protein
MKRAVQYALLITSEATRHIPDNLKNARPEVPWKDIHGLGNVLRHEYRRIEATIESLQRAASIVGGSCGCSWRDHAAPAFIAAAGSWQCFSSLTRPWIAD